MDLVLLVYGDPWSPELPPDAAGRPGLLRLGIVAGLVLLLVFGGPRTAAGSVTYCRLRDPPCAWARPHPACPVDSADGRQPA